MSDHCVYCRVSDDELDSRGRCQCCAEDDRREHDDLDTAEADEDEDEVWR